MKHARTCARVAVLTLLALGATAAAPAIRWQTWSPDAFAAARKQHKLVILDLHAVWCHWCHVMDYKTYGDAKVKRFIADHYVAVSVDQDSRPDLANRYEDYGWPATVIFDAQGRELAKFRGYIEPGDFLETLQNLVRDPNAEITAQRNKEERGEAGAAEGAAPGEEAAPQEGSAAGKGGAAQASGPLSTARLQELKTQLADFWDPVTKGWGEHHKFLQAEPTEQALTAAWRGDTEQRTRALQTLAAAQKLLDPVWGGVYQYSVDGWDAPHFEKIMSMQANNMQLYSMAATIFPDDAKNYLQVAQSVARYLQTFLRAPDGAFYTSQDADVHPGEHAAKYFALADAERRSQGMPKVDKHVYARDNGWAIAAHVAMFAAGGDDKALSVAQSAAKAIVAQRSLAKNPGGYSHDAKDAAGPYLADSLAMGQAHWALYQATGDRKSLQQALDSAAFIHKTFADAQGGAYLTAKPGPQSVLPPIQEPYENLALARWAHAMFEATANRDLAAMRESAMQAKFSTADEPPLAADLLLLNDAITQPPLHVCVVGKKNDVAASNLYRAALAYPEPHKRLEWWDRTEGPLPNTDVKYPELPTAAAFICTGTRCGAPVTDASTLATAIKKLTATKPDKPKK